MADYLFLLLLPQYLCKSHVFVSMCLEIIETHTHTHRGKSVLFLFHMYSNRRRKLLTVEMWFLKSVQMSGFSYSFKYSFITAAPSGHEWHCRSWFLSSVCVLLWLAFFLMCQYLALCWKIILQIIYSFTPTALLYTLMLPYSVALV